MDDCQYGFKQHVGTIDAIYCFKQLIKNKTEGIHCLFLDLRGAFDLLCRSQLHEIVKIMLGTTKIANILRAFHQNTPATIKSGTMSFKLGSGVRQGSDEGPNLFCLFLQYVLSVDEAEIQTSIPDVGVNFKFEIISKCNPRKLRSTGPASGSRRMFRILYADDIVFFDTDETRLNKVLAVVESVFTRFGLVIAEDKTKSMSFNLKPDEQPAILHFSTGVLEKVKNFRYLGYSPTLFLDMQIQTAFTAFNSNRRALTNRNISLSACVSLLDSLVRSRLLYSVQAWNLTQLEKERLDMIYRSILRKMVYKGYAKKDPQNGDYSFIISNQKLYEITRTVPLQDFIDKQFLKFQGHVTRLQNNKLQNSDKLLIRGMEPAEQSKPSETLLPANYHCHHHCHCQKEQTFSLGITVTVGLKKTSSNVYFTGARVRALYRFKSQGYTSIILYSILYSVFIRFSIKQIIFMVFLRNFTISIN